MNRLVILILAMFSLSAFANRGGVGGFEGGSIHFKRNSTWVNVMTNKTLCLNSNDDYQARVSKRPTPEERSRRDYKPPRWNEKMMIYQPRVDLKQVCRRGAPRFGRDEECRDRDKEWVPRVQKRDLRVIIRDGDRGAGKEITVRVPDC